MHTIFQRRRFLAALVVSAVSLSAASLAACSKPAEKPAPAPVASEPAAPKPAATLSDTGLTTPPDSVKVAIETDKGEIVVELDGKHAPTTTANFLHYVDTHKLDGGTFYRAMKSGPAGFVQMSASGFTYPPIPHESTKQTGLSHVNGTISTARYAVGTASNEFTICIGDMTYMDAGRDTTGGDNQGFAAFGHVVKGMDVVKTILHGRISNKKAAPGEWQGQTLAAPVKIISAHRVA